MDMETFSARAAVLGPLIIQGLAMVVLGIIVVVRDGSLTPDVIYGLLVVMLGNTGASALVGYKHASVAANPTPAPAQAQIPASAPQGGSLP